MWQITKNENWARLTEEFDWIQDMHGVPQDPQYHAEGDVAIHTQMVVEELQLLETYQQLNEQEQAVLFAAALLHDVEKRSTTVIEPDGSITSKGHAKKGAHTARALLYMQHAAPFHIREMITGLVRYHGFPLWFLEKPNMEQQLFRNSLEVDFKLLETLTKADVRGRICKDLDDMLLRVELFRETSEDHDCWEAPKAFASDLGRYEYFRKPDGSPLYAPFEGDCFEVVLLSGLPGAGKDHFINRHYPDWPVVSLDQLRRKMGVAPTDKKNNGRIVQLAKEQARQYLRKKHPFVWNATNITRSMREPLVDLFQTYGAKTTIAYIEVPYAKLLKQNRERAYPIPESVLHRLLWKLEPPAVWEAPVVRHHLG
jgi:predicted kinase